MRYDDFGDAVRNVFQGTESLERRSLTEACRYKKTIAIVSSDQKLVQHKLTSTF